MIEKIKNILKDIYSKGFFHLFSANSLIHVIEFGSQLFVAWILLADDIGRIKSFQSFAAIAVVIGGLGFNTSILKLCSEKSTTLLDKQTLFASAVKVTLLFSILTFLIILGLSHFGLVSSDVITNKFFVYYALSVPLIAINNLLIAYYQALKEFKKVSVLLVFARVVHVVIIITLTYLFALKGFILGVFIGFLISSGLLLSKANFWQGWKNTTKLHFSKNWGHAKYAFMGNAINMITLYLDIFLLNYFISDAKELGYYGFALTFIAGLRIVTSTAQQFVTPFYSEFFNEPIKAIKAFKRSNRLFMTAIFIVGLLAVFIVPYLIHYVFVGKYDSSMYYFQALVIAWMVRSWVSLKGPFLLAAGHIKVVFQMMLIVFIVSIIPYWYLVKEYQVDGAIYAQWATSVIFFITVSVGFQIMLKKIKVS